MLKSEIDINRMRNKLLNQGANFAIKDKLVLVKSCDSLNHKSGTAILTQNGFLVLWGQSNGSLESYRSLITESEECVKDILNVILGETRLCDGKILITNSDEREYDEIATSLALMTAVKLNFLEWDIKRNLEIRNTQLLSLKNSLVSQNLDRVAKALFELETYAHDCRYRLNLQGLLEYPDVLWDYDKQCDLFNRIQSLFEIPKRLDHLNHRLLNNFNMLQNILDFGNIEFIF
ncbi:uncharacterized protein TA10105 [Theileria annulata]|uniref:DUF155 domain-containing protein n=1 Tax=Theileria annulata TaxID=5874 RepID=Q4U8S9_THEAN|nr:uncharacterized protein TA10105 [Theileria annulata]CAI76774.1 hypothetical protein, conserved [Theileria annulata]|eukprot:XP_953399.1 hypothetical protein, conserved [Theileria annulata]